ncbi:DUF6911 family protein [Pectobacterium wasabiae]|uniref:Uncharacterized protein n=1 Tax=Pectobacterium wasabiae TaxID=55208 RepID=A0AAW3EFY8_9GAMM|nr:hypothetical protein [Pectobacterium wasabiae]AOR65489.1 hypothetical protein A7983_19940 [Pectobacterium wasabiae CFBP 3304]EJS93234.1 Hypothetical protein Y17_3572 [Pectobacterium wasabiae CFBP 3304]KFX05772.1 hypothetical protein JV38_13945 [Pectobacterium wasabiae]KGA30626.1 hypothetical protein KU73_01570 [Pectobacterium wasabiae]
MKDEFEVDFYLHARNSFTRVRSPKWSDVEEFLMELKGGSGGVRLRILPESDIGPMNLDVSTDDGFYLLTLLECSESDLTVRSYWDKSKSGKDKKIQIYGDYWPENQLTNDFDLVVGSFKEFFDTGNVSTDLLN